MNSPNRFFYLIYFKIQNFKLNYQKKKNVFIIVTTFINVFITIIYIIIIHTIIISTIIKEINFLILIFTTIISTRLIIIINI